MRPSLSLDQTLQNLTACGCCDGITIEAPVEIWNRAGLRALAARIGTHGRFKASLLSRLSSRDFPRLQALCTRDDEDFAIAFLDTAAVLADVLTFYQERIANESYLRTARAPLAPRAGTPDRLRIAAGCRGQHSPRLHPGRCRDHDCDHTDRDRHARAKSPRARPGSGDLRDHRGNQRAAGMERHQAASRAAPATRDDDEKRPPPGPGAEPHAGQHGIDRGGNCGGRPHRQAYPLILER